MTFVYYTSVQNFENCEISSNKFRYFKCQMTIFDIENKEYPTQLTLKEYIELKALTILHS